MIKDSEYLGDLGLIKVGIPGEKESGLVRERREPALRGKRKKGGGGRRAQVFSMNFGKE